MFLFGVVIQVVLLVLAMWSIYFLLALAFIIIFKAVRVVSVSADILDISLASQQSLNV